MVLGYLLEIFTPDYEEDCLSIFSWSGFFIKHIINLI